ncbi:hypothetical protein CUTER_10315 [Corynebacterium uterequi]|uniref:Uncharacterized protein n=1 Tax=Corynebacterium uterequi TaxID=1072256 RepID=A0A0G3HLL5_9CORY|nr:hypothetical protein CUTER_10315 [Corynebacterium uterequi]
MRPGCAGAGRAGGAGAVRKLLASPVLGATHEGLIGGDGVALRDGVLTGKHRDPDDANNTQRHANDGTGDHRAERAARQ